MEGVARHAGDEPGGLRARVDAALRTVIDPELGLDVVELGLVVSVDVRGSAVEVELTTTTPSCPLGEHLVRDAEWRIRAIEGVSHAEVRLVWDSLWSPDRMSAGARRALGWET